MTTQQSLLVRSVAPGDRVQWQSLYEGYLDFYKTALSAHQLDTVWSWLLDDDREVSGLVAEGPEGIVGLAHYRMFLRPSSASVGAYLDDLFVDPSARGSGGADALLAALRRIGDDRGWSVIRWVTADDNYRARGSMTSRRNALFGSPTT